MTNLGTPRTPGSNRAPRTRVLRGGSAPALRPGPLAELPAAMAYVAPVAAPSAEDGYVAGFAQGHAEGYEEGRALAVADAADMRRRLDRAWSAVTVAARGLDERTAVELDGLAQQMAEAAVTLAEAVIGRALAGSTSPGADALARALALAPPGVPAVARLHPADAELLGETPHGHGGVTVVSDPAVEPGGCVLDAGDCRIDAQLGPALARARAVLLGSGAGNLPEEENA